MKFSIVTPTYNSERFLKETIESVLSQDGDFEIEYIIVDGGSTDSTLEITKLYKKNLIHENITIEIFSEKDKGMYDAINKGFAKATGDIFAWINSDDLYKPGALSTIHRAFTQFPEIDWLKGITSFVDDKGKQYQYGRCYIYNRKWIELGIYGRNAYFIHQDSVFWKKSLWQKIGKINDSLKYAGDYDLWIKFAKHSALWSLNKEVSLFRKRNGQLSSDMTRYRAEQETIIPTRNLFSKNGFLIKRVKLFFWLQSKRPQYLQSLFVIIYKIIFPERKKDFIDVGDGDYLEKKQINSYIVDKKIKRIVILKNAGGELANQLWNYLSIYAYGLKIGVVVKNPSFFEYHSLFNFLPKESLFTRFLSLFFKTPRRRSHLINKIARIKYKILSTLITKIHSNHILSSKNTENKITYLPPTKTLPEKFNKLSTIYLTGWLFRNPNGLKEFRDELLKLFSPNKKTNKEFERIVTDVFSSYKKVIGVHIRQGDYRTFKDGRYLIEQTRIREIIDEYIFEKKIDTKNTLFLITSDGYVKKDLYKSLNIYISKENAVIDLFLLSKTETILGSDSSFGAFASWYGNIPHIVMKKEPIDWKYYADKTSFFENKYSELVPY